MATIHKPVSHLNVLALISLIISIVGMISLFMSLYLGIILGISALVLGIISISNINKDKSSKGKGLAISGIVLGIVIVLVAIALMAFIAAVSNLTGYKESSKDYMKTADNAALPSDQKGVDVKLTTDQKIVDDKTASQDNAKLDNYCGDKICSNDENCSTCPIDCGACEYCGNGICDAGESCSDCVADCGPCSYCGDGRCDAVENCSICPIDCGSCNSCGDGACTGDDSCSACPIDCGRCPTYYDLTIKQNTEPFYGQYCDKIDPYNLDVRLAAANAIRNDTGGYRMTQVFDVFDWVKQNIFYQNVPLSGMPYPPKETLTTGSGDCKNQAVLMTSMIDAIGGEARTVLDFKCVHAYTIVKIDKQEIFFQQYKTRYGNIEPYIIEVDGSSWLVLDSADGRYPGELSPACTGDRKIYLIKTCMTCSELYTNAPYTYDQGCLQSCPLNTTHANNHECSDCPPGTAAYNNTCTMCPDHYALNQTDGLCHYDDGY